MKPQKLSLLLALVTAVMAPAAYADSVLACALPGGSCLSPLGGTVASQGSRTDKTAFAGLTWEFGGKNGYAPNLVLGVRQLQVKDDNSVQGAELSFSLAVFQRQELDSVKLTYIAGNRDAQAKLGAGYSFEHGNILATGAIQGAHLAVGSDYIYGAGLFKPYVEINSYEKPRAVQKGSTTPLSCAAGLLQSSAGYTDQPGLIKDGQTCVVSVPG